MTERVEGGTFQAIGYVRSTVREPTDQGWGPVVSQIELLPEFGAGTLGLEGFSHVIVVAFLHRARFEPAAHTLRRRPQGRAEFPEVGIFAQRAKNRPNRIGITTVELLAVAGPRLEVRGLDAIDGTPVLDIKPYFPQYDAKTTVRTPDWVSELMRDYF
jgi:tRNA (adenine37-N6)-methyltransferase